MPWDLTSAAACGLLGHAAGMPHAAYGHQQYGARFSYDGAAAAAAAAGMPLPAAHYPGAPHPQAYHHYMPHPQAYIMAPPAYGHAYAPHPAYHHHPAYAQPMPAHLHHAHLQRFAPYYYPSAGLPYAHYAQQAGAAAGVAAAAAPARSDDGSEQGTMLGASGGAPSPSDDVDLEAVITLQPGRHNRHNSSGGGQGKAASSSAGAGSSSGGNAGDAGGGGSSTGAGLPPTSLPPPPAWALPPSAQAAGSWGSGVPGLPPAGWLVDSHPSIMCIPQPDIWQQQAADPLASGWAPAVRSAFQPLQPAVPSLLPPHPQQGQQHVLLPLGGLRASTSPWLPGSVKRTSTELPDWLVRGELPQRSGSLGAGAAGSEAAAAQDPSSSGGQPQVFVSRWVAGRGLDGRSFDLGSSSHLWPRCCCLPA